MKKVLLEIIALSHSVSQTQNYAIVLGEKGGKRKLPIVIGGSEAQAVAVAMEGIIPNRPLTHDLLKNVLEILDVELKSVLINNLLDGIFHARLICERAGEIIEIDSRTSDALALAVRFECPIYAYDFILDTAGVFQDRDDGEMGDMKGEDDVEQPKQGKLLEAYSVKELASMLEQVLSDEDYEQAAKIRDEMAKRSAS